MQRCFFCKEAFVRSVVALTLQAKSSASITTIRQVLFAGCYAVTATQLLVYYVKIQNYLQEPQST